MKKKITKKRKNKYDWWINAIECDEDEKILFPELDVEYRTSGFAKYGAGEIVVLGTRENAEKIAYLINTFGRMYKEGEEFDPMRNHCIDNEKGETQVKFNVVYGEYDNGEKWTQLIPSFWGGDLEEGF